jgi:uncharacterized protein (DUF1786 family)
MAPRELHYEGIHCNLTLQQPAPGLVVLRIAGSDVGEFGEAPMQALSGWLDGGGPVDFFIDAREVRGASIEVSGDWALWLARNRERLRAVTMLTGSRFIQVTAEFVRRFSALDGIMRVSTDPAAFDAAVDEALHAR